MSTFLSIKIPLWLALFVMLSASGFLGLKSCSAEEELRTILGEAVSLRSDNAELKSEAAALRLTNEKLANSRDGLLAQLQLNTEACTKQLTDRERIAAIKAGDSCVVQEVKLEEVVDGETSTKIVYFFNDLFAAGVQP